jgi:hypothetical protein
MTFDEIVDRGQQVGWIYVAGTLPDEPVKIGWARDPSRRLKTLQTARHSELTLLGVIPGTRHLENELHRKLRRARLVGEWFERRYALRVINPLIRGHGLFLTARAAKSRNSPEMPLKGRLQKREFVAVIREKSDA